MNNRTVNPAMIILARESRGWSQAELAEKIGLSPANLSKIERADIGVQEDTILKIGAVTNYPFQFFLQPGGILPLNLAYRKRQHVPQRIITPIEAKCNVIQRHIQFLTRALNKTNLKLPLWEVTERRSPKQIAQLVRRDWNVSTFDLPDLIQLVENAGIPTIRFDFGTERVDSRSMLTEDKFPCIILNSSLLGDRQRFSVAYELGHLIMHTFFPVSPERDIVKEANQFAAELLMPEYSIKHDFAKGITIPILGELKRKWKVSMIALLYRADDLGLLTANQKRYLVQQFNQLKIRRREPVELDIPAEKPALVNQLIAEYLSKTQKKHLDMADILNLEDDEYSKLYA